MKTLSVSQVCQTLHQYIEKNIHLENCWITGEISNVRLSNGHCYFILKDAGAQLNCICWASIVSRLPFRPENGMSVILHGKLNFYKNGGSLSVIIDDLRLSGTGELYLQLEKLKKQLDEQGYFAASHKKPKPEEINTIGIVTGKTTAALQDALKTIRTRWPMLKVKIYDTLVQGEQAPAKIVSALEQADQDGLAAVLLIRGGGSFEDLFCFNDERIVKALYNMKTYTVTGIGHEIDTSLADLVADHHSLTPTAAAQWVTPDQREVKARLDTLEQTLIREIKTWFNAQAQQLMYLQGSSPLANPKRYIQEKKSRLETASVTLMGRFNERFSFWNHDLERLNHDLFTNGQNYMSRQDKRISQLSNSLLVHSPRAQIQTEKGMVSAWSQSMEQAMNYRLAQSRQKLDGLESTLQALSWEKTLERGFAIVSHKGTPIKDARTLAAGESIALTFAIGTAKARVESVGSSSPADPNPTDNEPEIPTFF